MLSTSEIVAVIEEAFGEEVFASSHFEGKSAFLKKLRELFEAKRNSQVKPMTETDLKKMKDTAAMITMGVELFTRENKIIEDSNITKHLVAAEKLMRDAAKKLGMAWYNKCQKELDPM